MNATPLKDAKSLVYTGKTVERAQRALKCSPFQMPLFAMMRNSSVSLGAIANLAGILSQYTRSPLSEIAAENALTWLICVGVLRREVDGQGITDSFRLTPLGHQIIEQWQVQGNIIPSASLWERIYNTFRRWFQYL
jgi:hypothetical protein